MVDERVGHEPDCACGSCVVQVLREIRDKVDIQNPSSGSADNDFVWSKTVPASRPMVYPIPGDIRGNATIEYYDGTRPSSMYFIDMPAGARYPYVMIQASDRSIELVDDMTGLPVCAANPGQIMTAVIGESSRFRVILGAGVGEGRVTARFSTRPLQAPSYGNSGPIPLTPGRVVFTSGATLWMQGIFRNVSAARALIVTTRFYAADALASWACSLVERPFERGENGGTNGGGVGGGSIRSYAVGAVPNGGAAGSVRSTMTWYSAAIANQNVAVLGREFCIIVESNGAGAGVDFQAWYELVY